MAMVDSVGEWFQNIAVAVFILVGTYTTRKAIFRLIDRWRARSDR